MIPTDNLGCVMLRCGTGSYEPLIEPEWAANPDVLPDYCEGTAFLNPNALHLTLKYGLMPALVTGEDVDEALAGWRPPPILFVTGFELFGGGDGWKALVATVENPPVLQQANHWLSLLPHIDTWPGYRAHVTLGYIKSGLHIGDFDPPEIRAFITREVFHSGLERRTDQ
ncbi:MAG: hypothetical protein LBK42_02025 [Propionibacteriaceae bacterium]|jgi:hypothetical protein|nr:hypothetical protein [Propionibacteriaceae bacterium]